jgi:Tol biopolymer transport system component/GH35 family endo-1,4-beta-xylanase
MSKRYLIAIVAGGVIVVAVVALGLFYLYAPGEPSLPIFAFASDRSGAGDIFVLDRAGQIRNVTNHPYADWNPVWSQDGTMLAFTSHRTGDSEIWLLDLLETEKESHPRNLTNDPAWDYNPTWSPSKHSVAFVSERDGDPEIFIQNLESETALQLTFNDEMDRMPTWSPDGKLIAFAAVRDGVEKIYLIRPDGTDEQLATPHPLQGTAPAWSPDSQQLAFIGWDEENRGGIYIIGPDVDDLEQIYQGNSWLGSLNWSADGRWLTFTSWESGNHEVYAIPVTGGHPTRLTINEAWDDFLVINPSAAFSTALRENIAQAAPALRLPPNPNLAAGVNLADLGMAYLINDLGFDWGKGYVNWATVEPELGEFRWIDPDNIVEALGDQQVQILFRIHGTPAWARPPETSLSHPPNDMTDFANFLTALATRYRGKVGAYEIWNEPNLSYEWGNLSPDPVAYTEMLKTAYTAIKAVDPEALVISGGLSTTGNGSPTAYGDLAFLQGMYDAGAKGYFDAFGSHPYPFGRAPDEVDPWGLSFSRVEEQYQVMQANGDGDSPIWITETGWVLQSSWDLGEHQAISVTQEQQAQYMAEAYAKVPRDWPFVQAMFLFNLDFSTVSWYPAAEPMRWYAILNPDRTPRPAYTILREARRTQ